MRSNKVLSDAKEKIASEYKLTKADYKEAKLRGINKLDFKAMAAFREEKAEETKKLAEEKLKEEQAKLLKQKNLQIQHKKIC